MRNPTLRAIFSFACLLCWAGAAPADVKPGDFLVADPVADAVLLVQPDAVQAIVLQGPPLAQPRGVALDAQGDALVTDAIEGAVLRIDPSTGRVTATYQGPPLAQPYAIAVAADGSILVTDAGSGNVVRIDPLTGQATVVCAALRFVQPLGLALSRDGQPVVADYGSGTGKLVRFDPSTCKTTLTVTAGLQNPSGVATNADGNYLVADRGANDVVLVDAATGTVSLISQALQFQGLRGIAVRSDGAILVADYVAGSVFEVDPRSGRVTRTFYGGWLRGPNGLAPVLGQPPSRSTFSLQDGRYVWKITATDLSLDDTPLDLAGFMNRLVFQSGQPQVPDLVGLLTANDSFWWQEIQRRVATGATIQGRFTTSGTFEIVAVGSF